MLQNKFLKPSFLALISFFILLQAGFAFSQDDCSTREECEQMLKQYEEQIIKYQADITKTEQEKKTLNNQIAIVKKKISKLNTEINQSSLVIKDLKLQIVDTEDSITKTSDRIDESRARLASMLQAVHEEDQASMIEILFAENKISDFFDNLIALEALNSETQELLNGIKTLKATLEDQKESLDKDKEQTEKVLIVQQLQKKDSENAAKEQQQLLKLTEAEYQKTLKEKKDIEKKAAEIRAKLFQMVGVTDAPTFGEALEVAKSVGAAINVRPAFVLAVISQESAIGRNVGQCVLTDATTGAGKRISTGVAVSRLMKPSRDIQPFLRITGELGKDPYNTAVSCPLSIGYGGAMGPAQFIPSTWALYSDKIKNALGRPGNPWAILDSFTAAALYLYDLGASYQTTEKERTAASRYYGGSSSYANQVLNRASCIQSFIDSGAMSASCERLIF